MAGVSEEERIWAFIAWLLSIIGAVLALVLRPGSRYVRYWAYLSIAFFIVLVFAYMISFLVHFIPFIGVVIQVLIFLSVLVLYIVGILRVLTYQWWRPPIVYEIASLLGIEER